MKRRLFTLFAFASLVLWGIATFAWLFHYIEASHRTEGGSYFDLRAERFRGGFSITFAWPIGPSIVDDRGRLVEAHLAAASSPPPTKTYSLRKTGFAVWRGQMPVYVAIVDEYQSRGSPMPMPNATRNLLTRPHRFIQIFWPRWAMGVVALLAAILPALWLRNASHCRLRSRRLKLGQCVECGYDLRGGHDRCPECGGAAGAAAELLPSMPSSGRV